MGGPDPIYGSYLMEAVLHLVLKCEDNRIPDSDLLLGFHRGLLWENQSDSLSIHLLAEASMSIRLDMKSCQP